MARRGLEMRSKGCSDSTRVWRSTPIGAEPGGGPAPLLLCVVAEWAPLGMQTVSQTNVAARQASGPGRGLSLVFRERQPSPLSHYMSSSASSWFFALDDERIGPRTLDEMRDLMAAGVIGPATLVWTQGLAEWAPAASFPVLAQAPETPEAAEEETSGPPALQQAARTLGQPAEAPAAVAWRRLFARWFDTFTILMAGALATGYTTPEAMATIPPLIQLVAPMGTLLVQAAMIATFGTTPGKALSGLTVRTADGDRPGIGAALVRELMAWALGMGMGLSFVIPVTHALCYYRLSRRGLTHWDERLELTVQAGPLGPVRTATIVLLVGFVAMSLAVAAGAAR